MARMWEILKIEGCLDPCPAWPVVEKVGGGEGSGQDVGDLEDRRECLDHCPAWPVVEKVGREGIGKEVGRLED